MDLTTYLLTTADRFCAHKGISKARLATVVANDGKFFDRVSKGGGVTIKMYERFMDHFRKEGFRAPPPPTGMA